VTEPKGLAMAVDGKVDSAVLASDGRLVADVSFSGPTGAKVLLHCMIRQDRQMQKAGMGSRYIYTATGQTEEVVLRLTQGRGVMKPGSASWWLGIELEPFGGVPTTFEGTVDIEQG
jgi:hypothetical protein